MKNVFLIVFLMLCSCTDVLSEDSRDDDFEDGGADGDPGGDGDSDADADADADADSDQGCESSEECLNVPLDTCNDEESLIHYTGEAVCIGGECQYEFDLLECGYECAQVEDDGDYCKDSACDGVVCDDPPDDTCTDGTDMEDMIGPDRLVSYADEGECDETGSLTGTPGECTYGITVTYCGADACVQSPGDDSCE